MAKQTKEYEGMLPGQFNGVAGLSNTLKTRAAEGWTVTSIGYNAEGSPHYVVMERNV